MSNTRNMYREKKGLFSGLTVAFAIAAIFLFIVGGTVAYFFASTKNIVNTFTPAEVKCSVVEDKVEESGKITKKAITVKNEGTIPAYIRVCLTSYWDSVDNNDVNGQQTILGLDAKIPTFTLGTDWFVKDGYYYYSKPVEPNASTGDLLATDIAISVVDGKTQIIEVFAEAIQDAPDEAVSQAWGVTVSNGVLSAS